MMDVDTALSCLRELPVDPRLETIDGAVIDALAYQRQHGAPVPRITGEKRPEGMLRRHPWGGWVDPHTGRFLEFWLEGTLPTDDPQQRNEFVWLVARGLKEAGRRPRPELGR